MFPDENVSPLLSVSRDQRPLCSGSVQDRLGPGSVQLRSAQVCSGAPDILTLFTYSAAKTTSNLSSLEIYNF